MDSWSLWRPSLEPQVLVPGPSPERDAATRGQQQGLFEDKRDEESAEEKREEERREEKSWKEQRPAAGNKVREPRLGKQEKQSERELKTENSSASHNLL